VRATLDTLTEGVVILDSEQRIAIANQAFADLVGRPARELEGCKVSEFAWTLPEESEQLEGYPGSGRPKPARPNSARSFV
jgi:PAS domain S-box-containing protein